MEQQRNSFKRTSMGSMPSNRSKSSDMSIENILEQFKSKKPGHQDFVFYYVDDNTNYKRVSRGSDLINKLDEPNAFKTPFRNSNTNQNFQNQNQQIKFQIPQFPNRLSKQQVNTQIDHSCSCYINCQKLQCPCASILQMCIEGRCCSICIQLKNYIRSIQQIKNQIKSQKKSQQNYDCACKKTRCLKMYCQCFSKNGFCSQNCSCQDCLNRENSEIRQKARAQANDQQDKGCRCKRTKCQKKYCRCYGNGEKCNKYCQCQNCNNMNEQLAYIRRKKEQSIKIQVQEIVVRRQPCIQLPIEMEFQMPDFSHFNI